jgi:hypothetical protein
VTVTAFAVQHGKWEHAFGYVFRTRDRGSDDAALLRQIKTRYSGDVVSARDLAVY